MTSTSDLASFLSVLRSVGVEMYLDPQGNLRSRGKVDDAEVAGFIRANRAAVIRELQSQPKGNR